MSAAFPLFWCLRQAGKWIVSWERSPKRPSPSAGAILNLSTRSEALGISLPPVDDASDVSAATYLAFPLRRRMEPQHDHGPVISTASGLPRAPILHAGEPSGDAPKRRAHVAGAPSAPASKHTLF